MAPVISEASSQRPRALHPLSLQLTNALTRTKKNLSRSPSPSLTEPYSLLQLPKARMRQSILLWSLPELRRWVVLITQGQVKDFGVWGHPWTRYIYNHRQQTAPKIFLPTPATSLNPDPATPGVYTIPSVPSMMSALSASRPVVSSPLAGGAHHQPTHAGSQRPYAFPTSRALRPFPSASGTTTKKQPPTKMIQPPSNQQYSFVLDLSQAELRRQ